MAYSPGPYKRVAVKGGWDGVECERDGLLCRLVYNNPDNADLFVIAPALADALRNLCEAVLRAAEAIPLHVDRPNNCSIALARLADLRTQANAALALLKVVTA